MRFVADFHLHSKYSRAVSPSMTLSLMAEVGAQKGIDILTAADWTHPIWFKEISTQLVEHGEGIYKLKIQNSESRIQNLEKVTLFLLSTEVASIYKQGGKLRRIHNLLFVPTIEVAEKVSKELVRRGCNLTADGRPIVGISSKHLLELLLHIDERAFLIPCHVWTPHFGVYGSASGFDSLEEAFGEMAKYVYGIETGLSSDPEMNWQVEELRYRSILSFSDAHSAAKMAREATVFDLEEVSYGNIREAIMRPMVSRSQLRAHGLSLQDKKFGVNKEQKTMNKIAYTVEFYPEEGKYHFSGHRNCKVSIGPEEIRNGGNMCNVCGRKLTEGVLFRVQQLSSKDLVGRSRKEQNDAGVTWYTDALDLQPPFMKLVPLLEIVAESLGSTVASQKSQKVFSDLCEQLGGELRVLLEAPVEDVRKVGGSKLAEGIMKVREGNIAITPGYDGEYGKVRIWENEKKKKKDEEQLGLF